MLENLTTLVLAKVKAAGLVAGTAMVTTALVGGGAVAVTVVSNDRAVDATGEQLVQSSRPDGAGQQRSDTATAAIETKGEARDKSDKDGEDGTEGCGDAVSAVAEAKADGTSGRDHGAAVSSAARTCNGSLGDGDGPGRSAGKGSAGKPETPGRAGSAGRPQSGPGSQDWVDQRQAERRPAGAGPTGRGNGRG